MRRVASSWVMSFTPRVRDRPLHEVAAGGQQSEPAVCNGFSQRSEGCVLVPPLPGPLLPIGPALPLVGVLDQTPGVAVVDGLPQFLQEGAEELSGLLGGHRPQVQT